MNIAARTLTDDAECPLPISLTNIPTTETLAHNLESYWMPKEILQELPDIRTQQDAQRICPMTDLASPALWRVSE